MKSITRTIVIETSQSVWFLSRLFTGW